MLKRCYICKKEQPVAMFSRNRSRSDGFENRCKQCDHAKGKEWYVRNKARVIERHAKWREKNALKFAEYSATWRRRHPAKVLALREKLKPYHKEYHKLWYAANLESKRAKNRQWHKSNPAAHAAICARRRAAELHRRVPWADNEAIGRVYETARRLTLITGVPHEVDHVFPLQGKIMSGLHVETNLCVTTRVKNRSRGNRI